MRYAAAGLYDEHEVAEQVFKELDGSGLGDGALHMVSHTLTDLSNWSPKEHYWDRGYFGHDMVERLVRLGFPQEDAELYCEGVRRGGTLVVAEIDEAHKERTAEIMNRHLPVDIHARVGGWRERGYTGYDENAEPYTADYIRREREYLSQENTPVTEDRIVRFGRGGYL